MKKLHHWSNTSVASWPGFLRYKSSHALYSLCTREARSQQLFPWPWNLKNQLFLRRVEDKQLQKKTSLLKGLLRASFQRSSSNTSVPCASYISVHQLDQARLSLWEEGFLFSLPLSVPAQTVSISKVLLSEADCKPAAHLSPAHFREANVQAQKHGRIILK